ncbi:hypothetical protein [Leptolyngbya sp. NIES-2104]|uniref:hypothetical protein n=1 Tax=Leptolyngbya sp. NIES-2104 TaxID=1552121 RepID=UPI0006ECAF04|nr:hypothetical protein [Leptolyngbya sp. NIES-2104]GAQ00165.1 hypothetical protein NIES2104_67300 [Leptolyngbya sp. NIES-2104]
MRLSIVKRHHQQLLMEVAASLRSDDPKDGLEHILNCWIQPCLQSPQTIVLSQSESTSSVLDDIEAIASWD